MLNRKRCHVGFSAICVLQELMHGILLHFIDLDKSWSWLRVGVYLPKGGAVFYTVSVIVSSPEVMHKISSNCTLLSVAEIQRYLFWLVQQNTSPNIYFWRWKLQLYFIFYCVELHQILYLNFMIKNISFDIMFNFSIQEEALLLCVSFNSLVIATPC